MVKPTEIATDPVAWFTEMLKSGPSLTPGVAVDKTVARNLDALKQANQLALEGMQTIARRQAEIIRGGMEEASSLMRDLATPASTGDRVTRQTEAAKKALAQSIANARELAEIWTRAGNDAFDVINRRVGESLDEMRDLVAKSDPPKK